MEILVPYSPKQLQKKATKKKDSFSKKLSRNKNNPMFYQQLTPNNTLSSLKNQNET